MDPSKLLHKRISLISRTNIRYEGLLESINKEEKTIVLSKVRALGTETRTPPNGKFIEPRDTVYEEICFHSNDLISLSICDDEITAAPTQVNPAEATMEQNAVQNTTNVQIPASFNPAENSQQFAPSHMPPPMMQMPNIPNMPFGNPYYGMPSPQNMNEFMQAQFYHYYMSYMQSQHMAAQGFQVPNGFAPQFPFPYPGQASYVAEQNLNQISSSPDDQTHQAPSESVPVSDSQASVAQETPLPNTPETVSSSPSVQTVDLNALIIEDVRTAQDAPTQVPTETIINLASNSEPKAVHETSEPSKQESIQSQSAPGPQKQKKDRKHQAAESDTRADVRVQSKPQTKKTTDTSITANSNSSVSSIKLHTPNEVASSKPKSMAPPPQVAMKSVHKQPKSFEVGESIPVTIVTRSNESGPSTTKATILETTPRLVQTAEETKNSAPHQHRRYGQYENPRKGVSNRRPMNRNVSAAGDASLLEEFDFVTSTLSFDKEKFINELEAKLSTDTPETKESPTITVANYQKSKFFDNLSQPLGKQGNTDRLQQRRVDLQTFGSAVKDYKGPSRKSGRQNPGHRAREDPKQSTQGTASQESATEKIAHAVPTTLHVATPHPRAQSVQEVLKNPPNRPHTSNPFNRQSQDRRYYAPGNRSNTHRQVDNPRTSSRDSTEPRSSKPTGQSSGFRGGDRHFGSST
eukprot:TRINITY_DN3007_c0_g1_i1.p1 TRINITY_DN3007_c0_g1~~TRINITY_DN3007_c0_g1_i1.p1  ORF type:complete len:691 (-),score=128.69 TRINITY_DN3007_c0_g1_i1:693-2765(-)